MSEDPDNDCEWSAHASAVVVGETGVLIRGPSGSGKSRLALRLIDGDGIGAHARLVADDRVRLRLAHGRLVARAHPAVAGLIEQRGQGLLRAEWEPAAVVGAVVDLVKEDRGRDIPPRLPETKASTTALRGVNLPRLAIPQALPSHEAAQQVHSFLRRLRA